MRITLLSAGTLYPLAGQAGVSERVHSSAGDLRISEGIETQTSARVRAASVTHFDRLNLAADISFSTTRTFATPEAAAAWAMDYSTAFPRTGTLIIDPVPAPGWAESLTISGTLTDGTDPVVFAELVYAGLMSGRPCWTNDGSLPTETATQACVWNGTDSWLLIDTTSVTQWVVTEDVASPELATGPWAPTEPPTTGVPTIAADYAGRRYLSNAIVHPPDRQCVGCSVLLTYRVDGAAFTPTLPS
jgi:hypothetical protein